jgi:hypothetical protein
MAYESVAELNKGDNLQKAQASYVVKRIAAPRYWQPRDLVVLISGPDVTPHQKEVVGVGVRMPDKLALHLDDHDVVVVELRYRARCPVFTELGELLGQVDRVSHCTSLFYGAVSRQNAAAMADQL